MSHCGSCFVLFQPTFREFHEIEQYKGRRSFNESVSAKISEHMNRWRHELAEAIKAGKTVFVFLPPLEEVFLDSGQRTYSGTGRNRQTTRLVGPANNYQALPFDLGTIVPKGGTEIRIARDLKQLAQYWSEFGSDSPYHVYLKEPKGTAILTATSPDAVVGLLIRTGKGTAVLLPPAEYDATKFIAKNEKKESIWTKEALRFGNKLHSLLLEIDRALRAEGEITPAPEWSTLSQYRLSKELLLEAKLKETDAAIEQMRKDRAVIERQIANVASLRDLLYETGKPLERAILKALTVLGFVAKTFKDDGSEFDAVFTATEGRFLGEVEGKNDKAVSIDKLDQLERNIREDFARQKTGDYAKGVLFGNAYRLTDPEKRGEFFTEKCYAGAKRGRVALVLTTDLFEVARYLDENDDKEFAAACRMAILGAEGDVVKFPKVPAALKGDPAAPGDAR